MGTTIDLVSKRTQVQKMVNDAKAMYAEIEAEGEKATVEKKTQLNKLIEDGQTKRAELDNLEKLAKLDTDLNQPATEPQAKEDPRPGRSQHKSVGQHIIESKEFKAATESDGMGRVVVPETKALYNFTQTVATGILADNVYQPEIINLAQYRPPSVVDMVNVSPTTSAAVEYILMTSRTNNAAIVAEYASSAYGLKPESNLAFDLKVALVKTIATWIAVSRQILSDAPRLRNTIDVELTYMIRLLLEDQIINGNGTGNNFTGIMATSGIQTRTQDATTPVGRGQVTTDTILDTVRRAITDIRLAFYEPDGLTVNPAEGEKMELLKNTQGSYLMMYDPVAMRVWRVKVVETAAQPAGTGICGNFRLGATMWDREEANVSVGQPNDYFLRNAFAVLAELRAAFAVVRPQAFEKITFA